MKDNKPSQDHRMGNNTYHYYYWRQRKDVIFHVLVLLVVFFMGYFLGGWQKEGEEVDPRRFIGKNNNNNNNNNNAAVAVHGSVLQLQDLPFRDTSHINPQTGQPIRKKQFIEPFKIPNMSGFQVASFQPGIKVETHEHESMHEIFYVVKGKGIFTVDGVEHEVTPGTMVHIAPHEKHNILALESSDHFELAWFGVTV